MSVGPVEPQFYAQMAAILELPEDAPNQFDAEALRPLLVEKFKSKTMAEWSEIFDGTDACVAPVLTIPEAAEHPHVKARGIFTEVDGMLQPTPAPRFSRTAPSLTTPAANAGADTREALAAWGVTDVDKLIETGVASQA
jgi:alpha-methylacyl-CoA racemase